MPSLPSPALIRRGGREPQSISLRLHRNIRWRGKYMNESRRRFLRNAGCGLTAAAMVSSLDRLGLVNAMVQQQPDVASDYKALVCIFLSGGTDCNNMVVPVTHYSDVGGYDTVRTGSGLAIPQSA